jgi:hypothetical protein
MAPVYLLQQTHGWTFLVYLDISGTVDQAYRYTGILLHSAGVPLVVLSEATPEKHLKTSGSLS